MNKDHSVHISLAHGPVCLLAACSVQKNTGLSRAYHNLTARYNVFFNGNESFKKGIEKIDTDFKMIIPKFCLFSIMESKDAATLASRDMDRTIKKCSKLISLHSITAKPKVRDNKTSVTLMNGNFSVKKNTILC